MMEPHPQDDRCFKNLFKEYQGENLLGADGRLKDSLRKEVHNHIDKLLEILYSKLPEPDDDYSVYTGVGGIAMLHMQIFSKLGNEHTELKCALDYLRHPIRHLKGRRISFLCGDAGPLALAAVINDKLGNRSATEDCVARLVGLHRSVCEDSSIPDELLYGRAGYLYALLYVQSHLGNDAVSTEVIEKVYKCMVDSGLQMAQQQGWRHPLMYAWHEKHYLGAAHGLAGIFYILLQVKGEAFQKYKEELIRPSLEYMLSLQFLSGNCPSSIGSSTGDKLIHWCHGAPGWIHVFIAAYKEYGDDKYLQAAKSCANVVWSRGLLKKGYGLCHGISGNAYAFLAMYQLTDEQAYLHKALMFANVILDMKAKVRTPDHPFSLFEGLAGTIYFLIDLLDPKKAQFPAFNLPVKE